MIKAIFSFLTGGFLGRVLDTVDKRIELEGDKEKIKGDIIVSHYNNRATWMKAGGMWLMLMFAIPLALWFGSVCLYSILWCQGCAYPQAWSIAALPPPLDEWAGTIIISIFGVIGVTQFRK